MPTRILIADDDVSIRRLLRRLLEDRPDWQVCGEATNGQEAVFQAEKLKPEIAVLDLAMPCMNGLEAAREISKVLPKPAMLLLTVQEVSAQLVKEARDAGFHGAVSKGTGAEVIKGIESLLNHQTFFKSGPATLPALPHSAVS
jgi:DNA-binding NarL/FixJ family response regulator